jgi:hypothetical protein
LPQDLNAHIVGYVAGPNEREPAVPAAEILALTGIAARAGVEGRSTRSSSR